MTGGGIPTPVTEHRQDETTPAGPEKRAACGVSLLSMLKDLSPNMQMSERLGKLTATLKDVCRLTSIRLYFDRGGGPVLFFSAGREISVDTFVEVHDVLASSQNVTTIRHDPETGMLLNRVIVPVDSTDGSGIAVAYEIDSARKDLAEIDRIVSAAYQAMILFSKAELGISLAWLNVLAIVENEANDASKSSGASSALILTRVLDRLKDTGFIAGYYLLSADDIRDGHKQLPAGMERTGGGGMLSQMTECVRTLKPVFDRISDGSISFPVHDDENRLWAVTFVFGSKPLLKQEKELWERIAFAFDIMIRAFVLKAKSSRQAEEMKRLKSDASAFLEVSRSIENADTVSRLTGRSSEGISIMMQEQSYPFVREDDFFVLYGQPADAARVNAEEIASLISSSMEVSRYVHELPLGTVGKELPVLAGFDSCDFIYIAAIYSKSGELASFVACPGHRDYSLSKTKEDAITGIAAIANTRMNAIGWAEEAAIERKKMKKVEEVVSRISFAEGDNSIVSSIVDAASILTNSDMAALVILDAEKKYVVGSGSGFDVSEEIGDRWIARGVTGRILRTMEAEIINDYANDPDKEQSVLDRLKFRRIAAVPVRVDMKNKGVLAAINTRDGRYGTEHLRTLELLSNIASSAIRAMNARKERRKLVEDFDKLQTAELKLYSSRTYGELIELLAEEVKRLFHASAVLISTEVNNVKRILYSTCQEIEEGDVVYNSGPIGLQFDEQPHVARIAERVALEEEWSRTLETNELLLVRAGTQHNSIVIAAVNGSAGPKFGTDEIGNFSKLSKIASTALDKMMVLGGMNQKLKHLEIMHTIVDALVYGKNDYEILDGILPTLVDMCGADLGLFWKYEEENRKVRVSAEYYRNRETEHLIGYEVGSKKGIVGSVITNRMPVLIANAAIDSNAVHISGTNIEKFESVLGVPLIIGGKLLGVLMVYRDNPPPFTSTELDMLSSVSNDISLVMARQTITPEKGDPALPGTD